MTETLIKNFTEISKADTGIAGGKGASLGEMTQAGIPVPEGFVILSNAFDRFIEETDLNFGIDAILDTVDIKKVHTVENASEKIQAMIISKEMPKGIRTEVLKFYKNLDSKFVAVRSSATSEDSASAAWAGQLDSFLNTAKDTLLENVKKCWASLFTARAIFYRFEKKLDKDKISVAVVVQKMVDSEESGIAFSVHPVTQDENQIIIEAGFGLGEAIVSGSITPDSYVVDKEGFSILDINVNEQTKALYKKSKGGNEWKELGEKGKKQVLTEKEIIELSKLIVKIENHYGFPCDIEWAKEKGKFYIVQSRPITTLNNKVIKIDEVNYQKHQRDYTLLGTSIVFRGYLNKETSDYFNYISEPMFVLIEEGILYHFTAEKDSRNRVANWIETYNINELKKHKIAHDKVLNEYRNFLKENQSNLENPIKKLHIYFEKLLPLILVAIEVPEYGKDKVEKEIIDICMQIRKENEDVYKIGFDTQKELLLSLEEKWNIKKNSLKYLTQEELNLFLSNKKLPNGIEKRMNFVLVKESFNGTRIFYEKDKLNEFGLDDEIIGDVQELKGNIAFKGIKKGKVKIIKLIEDAKDLENGDILVTGMTDPRYVPYMKKASAIVTDEGGITCHAAIVSRELCIPCVIGTKYATKILKDGDLVEVDANEGVVKLIKKHHE